MRCRAHLRTYMPTALPQEKNVNTRCTTQKNRSGRFVEQVLHPAGFVILCSRLRHSTGTKLNPLMLINSGTRKRIALALCSSLNLNTRQRNIFLRVNKENYDSARAHQRPQSHRCNRRQFIVEKVLNQDQR